MEWGDEQALYLGIDIGSISVKIMVLDSSNQVILTRYQRFKGRPLEVLFQQLKEIFEGLLRPSQIVNVGLTGSGCHQLAELWKKNPVNEVVAQACGTSLFHPEVRTIIEMGGEDSKLILLENDPLAEEPLIKDFSMNTICAAGTGSFLEQQAVRLGLDIEGEFGRVATQSSHPPRIAGRCSVFAKSDMIHLQQIGTPMADIVAGLCYAVARNFKSTLAKGKKLERPIAFQGGVAGNAGMRKAFEEILELKPGELIIPKYYAILGAAGAALSSRKEEEGIDPALLDPTSLKVLLSAQKKEIKTYHSLSSSGYSELRSSPQIMRSQKGPLRVYLGIDVGSLSTNVVAINEDKEVVARRYLKTAGRPLEVVKHGLMEIGEELGDQVEVLGVGTTGSGRYLTAQLVGADIIKNEITAQATAAINIDPGVDTIFEIGGQDSKYISLENGIIVDFEMNKVCAAGTGSFLEEQAERLGIDIVDQFGNLALSAQNPCRLGDRCTVFMESDLVANQYKGADLPGLVAGLCYSIVYNYLHRVVGDRKIGNKIFFQGGVASNQGVVAAFRKVLGKDITVPPNHDVTGAIGVAILAKEMVRTGPSRFKGFDLSKRHYDIEKFHCQGCDNQCEINKVRFEGERPQFYGARCERYEIAEKRERGWSLPNLFEERQTLLLSSHGRPTVSPKEREWKIGLPRILHFHEFLPFWQTFFSQLGCQVVVSPLTNQRIINLATEHCLAETCFPIKIAFGHIISLLEQGLDFIFLPSLLQYPSFSSTSQTEKKQTCPYIPALPYMMASFLRHQGLAEKTELLQPILNFGWGQRHWQRSLIALGKRLGRSPFETKRALDEAIRGQQSFYDQIKEQARQVFEGTDALENALVLVSRPYNGFDSGINLGIVNKLKNLGVYLLPLDHFLAYAPPDPPTPEDRQGINIYWHYGKKIIQAARYIRRWKQLGKTFYPLYLTNFGCGPDSFLIGFFKKELPDHPLLLIELDEHSADAGLVTRCEAFLDSINQALTRRMPVAEKPLQPRVIPTVRKSGTRLPQNIYIPYMGDGSHALEAAFRAHGINAQVLPVSDEESLELGKAYAIGKECLPFILTLGDFLKKLGQPDFDPENSAFFMPTSEGPCRFGLYFQRHRQIFEQIGYRDVIFISPNQGNADGYYNELAKLPPGFSRTGWEAIVAFELFEKLHRAYRPYVADKAQIDRLYQEGLRILTTGIIQHRLEEAVLRIVDMYRQLPRDTSLRKPIIGIVGEIYLRSHPFSNNYLIEKIERLGGEVWLASTQEWIMFVSHWLQRDSWERRDYRAFLRAYFKRYFQLRDEHRILRLFKRHFPDIIFEEPETELILKYSDRYLHHSCGTEAVLSLGRALDFAYQGASGIISVMPFTCMPGTIAGALLRDLQHDFHNLPCLSLAFDGLEDTQLQARLEAFMYQAHQYQRKRQLLERRSLTRLSLGG